MSESKGIQFTRAYYLQNFRPDIEKDFLEAYKEHKRERSRESQRRRYVPTGNPPGRPRKESKNSAQPAQT